MYCKLTDITFEQNGFFFYVVFSKIIPLRYFITMFNILTEYFKFLVTCIWPEKTAKKTK